MRQDLGYSRIFIIFIKEALVFKGMIQSKALFLLLFGCVSTRRSVVQHGRWF